MTIPDWVWATAFVVGLAGLRRANLPRPLRYRQVWSPVAAVLLTVLALLVYYDLAAPLHQVGSQALAWVQGLLARVGLGVPNVPGVLVLLANLVLLLGFVLLKGIVNAALRLLHARLGRFGIAPAYSRDPEQGVHLRPEWDFPGRLLRWTGAAVGVGVVLLSVGTATAPPSGSTPLFVLPILFVLPALLLLEMGWYLGGLPRTERPGSLTGEDAQAERVGTYEQLWHEYQALWPDHLLAASRHLPPAGVAAATALDPRPERDADEAAALRVWHRLLGQGHALTDAHRELLLRLWRGEDALVEADGYEGVGPVVLAALHRALTAGHRALVLLPAGDARTGEAVATWLRDGLRAADEMGADWEVADLDALHRHGARPDVLLATPTALLQTGALHDAWFERVRPVLVLDAGETVLAAPLEADALVRVLRARVPALQRVVLAAGRRNLEAAVRATLGAAPQEYRPPRPAPATAFALVWRREHSPWFQAAVMHGAPERYLGAAPVLALPAWREGVRPVLLLGHEDLPWDELVEEIQNHRAGLTAPVASDQLRGTAREVIEVPAVGPLLPRRARAFAVVYDRQCNLPAALAAALPLGHDAAFVHVVAPPYLLRDYLAAHAGYFLRAPLRPLAPRVGDSAAAVAFALIERMTAGPVEEGEVLRELRAVAPDARFVEDALPAVFEAAFGLDLRRHDVLRVEETDRFDSAAGAFVSHRTYRLDPEVRRLAALDALRPFRVLDQRDGGAGGVVLRGWLYQRYLPRQIHAFQGKPHEIERVDEASGVLRVDFRDVTAPHTYRPVLEVELEAFHPARSPAHRRRMERGGWRVEAAIGQGAFRVRTHGYYAFPGPIHLTDEAARFEPLSDVPERTYPQGRLLRLALTPPAAAGIAEPVAVADALAVLLGEVARTLFPETHPFLLIAAPDGAESTAEGPRRALRPRLVLDEGMAPPEEGAVVVYAFEDAPAPMGLTLALLDAWEEVLALLDDYLWWVYEEDAQASKPEDGPSEDESGESIEVEAVRTAVASPDPRWRLNLLRRDGYLRYGLEEPPIAAEAAHGLLRAYFGAGNGLTRERRGYYALGRVGGSLVPRRACDFCGEEVPPAEFERLDDGRERCAACAESAVDTLAELRGVLKEARRFLARDLGHPVRRDVHVEFAGPDRIAAAARGRFMPTAEFDRRAIGLAIRQGRRYAILVENGHARHATLATVVHELTHIWQYTHLDVERMRAEHGLLLIEGHAVWAELACLARKELAPAYRERQARRVDVYGHGYRYVEAWLEREAGYRTAFDLLLATYPRR